MEIRHIPVKYQKLYERAANGKASPRMAIKAFCQSCVGYDVKEIRLCTDETCPLYRYRPYQRSHKRLSESSQVVETVS